MADARRARVPILALSAWIAGCGAPPAPAPPPPSAAPAATSSAERYLPLTDGTVFAYDTQSELTGERGVLMLEVRRRAPDRAELVVAGHVRRLTVDETGIRHVTGGWLLKEPLRVGATFPGDFGEVRVTAVDRALTTPAGDFRDCLETVETLRGADFTKSTTTTYCPHVGIVARRTEVDSDEGAGAESLLLRSHGPRVDLTSP